MIGNNQQASMAQPQANEFTCGQIMRMFLKFCAIPQHIQFLNEELNGDLLERIMKFKDPEESAEEIFEEYKDIKFVLTFQAACFQFDKRFFVKKPLRPGCPDFPFQTLNIIYEHQMLQVIRMLSEESLYSFQEMFILNEDKTEVIDYYAYRRRIKTLEDL
jgi:hypothetical protein